MLSFPEAYANVRAGKKLLGRGGRGGVRQGVLGGRLCMH